MKHAYLLIGLVMGSPAAAHEAHTGMKYDAWCCNGSNVTGDCQAIPSKRVRVIQGSYQIELRPGDHRLVTAHHLYTIPQSEARRSEDGDYHICLYPTEDTLRCLYAPDMSF